MSDKRVREFLDWYTPDLESAIIEELQPGEFTAHMAWQEASKKNEITYSTIYHRLETQVGKTISKRYATYNGHRVIAYKLIQKGQK